MGRTRLDPTPGASTRTATAATPPASRSRFPTGASRAGRGLGHPCARAQARRSGTPHRDPAHPPPPRSLPGAHVLRAPVHAGRRDRHLGPARRRRCSSRLPATSPRRSHRSTCASSPRLSFHDCPKGGWEIGPARIHAAPVTHPGPTLGFRISEEDTTLWRGARRELAATGLKVRKRSTKKRDEVTPQEGQIARLARDGLSNPEIAEALPQRPHCRMASEHGAHEARHQLPQTASGSAVGGRERLAQTRSRRGVSPELARRTSAAAALRRAATSQRGHARSRKRTIAASGLAVPSP